MSQIVGIPRALLFYDYYPLWKTFFESLGMEIYISPKTNKKILETGIDNTVEEACLPVKLAIGHIKQLSGKVDYILLPRIISAAPKEYNCPKILGFPDMAKACVSEGTKVLDGHMNLYESYRDMWKFFKDTGKQLGFNQLKVKMAYEKGVKALKKYRELLEENFFPREAMSLLEGRQMEKRKLDGEYNIAVIGHPYNLYDGYINLGVIDKLEDRYINVFTPDNLPEKAIRKETATLSKRLFWTLGQHLLGSAFYYIKSPDISGIIHMTSFGCGIDSMIGEIMEREAAKYQMPFMRLVLDEHTGEAGVVTRLEAFLDMLERREKLAKERL